MKRSFFVFLLSFFLMAFAFEALGQEDNVGKQPKKVRVKNEKPEKPSKEQKVKKEKKQKQDKTDEPEQKPKIAPPGMVRLKENLYIDVNPIKNIDYREFLSFLGVTYSRAVRDSLDNLPMWGIDFEGFRQFMRLAGNDKEMLARSRIRLDQRLSWAQNLEEYLNNPTYNNNPVVCVSYNQAREYAAWRTRIVMLKWAVDSKNEKQRSKYYTRIQYRLPTPEEWDEAMKIFAGNVILNKAIFPHNVACTFPAVPQKRKPQFYYVPGNVAELTSIENLAVGISWKDNDTTDDYTKRVEYFAPRDWLGFRCVCEIIEY